MSATRIYIVRETLDNRPAALIRASSAAQAARHYMMRNYEVTVATQDEIIEATKACIDVADAAPVPTES